jgi:hypothetical protein
MANLTIILFIYLFLFLACMVSKHHFISPCRYILFIFCTAGFYSMNIHKMWYSYSKLNYFFSMTLKKLTLLFCIIRKWNHHKCLLHLYFDLKNMLMVQFSASSLNIRLSSLNCQIYRKLRILHTLKNKQKCTDISYIINYGYSIH